MSEPSVHILRPDRPADHARVLLILSAALIAIFHADLFSGADLFFKAYRDLNPMLYSYPMARLDLASWRAGLFPLWNPYSLLGTPLLAAYQSAVFSPLIWPLVFGPIEALAVPYLLARLLLAGWGTYLFCRRLGMGRTAATAAAVCFGLTGYLMQYMNDQNVVIDLLIPWLLIAEDRLARDRRFRDFILAAAVSVLVILGGQPGSAIFTLALGYGWALFVIFTSEPRQAGALGLLAGAGAAAGIICLPQLLPFLEFLSHAWTFHQAGFGAEHLPPAGLITLMAPGFWGPLDQARSVLPLIRIAPYIGGVPAVLAVSAALRPRRASDAFFAAVLVLGLGVLAGLPIFDLLPRLPGLALLTFIKYQQPLVAFAAAFLAGTACDELRRGRGRLRLAASSLVMIVTAAAASAMAHPALGRTVDAMNGAVLLLAVTGGSVAVLTLASTMSPRARRAASAVLLALVLLDLVFASVVNRPYVFSNLAREDFAGIKKIVRKNPYGRFIASADVMLPDQGPLVPAFQLGFGDALILKDGVDLFRELSVRSDDEFYREFMRYTSLRLPLDTPPSALTRLVGLRFRLSRTPLPANRTIDAVMAGAASIAPAPAHIALTRMRIGDDEREAIFAHPPSAITFTPAAVEESGSQQEGRLSLSAGLDPRVKDLPGDGVWFTAATTAPALVWARYLDPRRQSGDRVWKNAELKVPASAALTLATAPAASRDNDWAAWGDVRLGDGARPPDRMEGGIRSYEDREAGLRLFLADPGTPEQESQALGGASLNDYGLQRVTCRTDARADVLFVLADAYYPGWRAWVNGEEERIIKTTHGLRAVAVPQGKSETEFVYEPVSFRVAVWAALACLAFALAAVLVKARS